MKWTPKVGQKTFGVHFTYYFHLSKKVGDLSKASSLVQAFDLLIHNNRPE